MNNSINRVMIWFKREFFPMLVSKNAYPNQMRNHPIQHVPIKWIFSKHELIFLSCNQDTHLRFCLDALDWRTRVGFFSTYLEKVKGKMVKSRHLKISLVQLREICFDWGAAEIKSWISPAKRDRISLAELNHQSRGSRLKCHPRPQERGKEKERVNSLLFW